MPEELLKQVENYIRNHALLKPGGHVLVAVSGGADSVALLNILQELSRPLRLRLTVAHLNHKIRGKDAEEDARFVKQLAHRLHLNFALGRVNVPRLAGRLGISLEMAGRRARYNFFEKTALAQGCDVVATAHTADDSVESILIMLLRGCGLQGLTGITPLARIGKITLVRPLLGTGRPAIEKYLRERNLIWREDASNADPAFLRNRVRHELLPLLEAKYNKGIRQTLIRLADVLRSENELLDALTATIYAEAFEDSDHALDCAIMVKYPLAARRRVLRHWLKANDINAGTLDFQTINKLDSLLMNPAGGRSPFFASLPETTRVGQGKPCNLPQGESSVAPKELPPSPKRLWRTGWQDKMAFLASQGSAKMPRGPACNPSADEPSIAGRLPRDAASLELAGGIIIRRNYQRLEIEEQRTKPNVNFSHKIRIPGRTILPEAGLIVRAKLAPGVDRERAVFGKFPVRASISLKKLGHKQILVRPWRPGDRMHPYGLDGSKKIQDIFSDAKLPAVMRRRLPIFVCGKEIIWIPGYRIAEGWQVPDLADPGFRRRPEALRARDYGGQVAKGPAFSEASPPGLRQRLCRGEKASSARFADSSRRAEASTALQLTVDWS